MTMASHPDEPSGRLLAQLRRASRNELANGRDPELRELAIEQIEGLLTERNQLRRRIDQLLGDAPNFGDSRMMRRSSSPPPPRWRFPPRRLARPLR